MKTIIRRFETYQEIELKPGELGFCFDNETLYIGIEETPGFKAVSSDEAAVEELKARVEQVSKEASDALETLRDKLYGFDETLDDVEKLDGVIRDLITTATTELSDEDARIGELVETLETKVDGNYEAVNGRVDDAEDEIERIDEVLQRPIQYKSAAPDWEHIGTDNLFASETEITVERSGYVLVQLRGLADFKVTINGAEVVDKARLEDDELRADMEVIFSQLFQVETGDVVKIVEDPESLGQLTQISCRFVPPRTIDVDQGMLHDHKKLVDVIYPIGSIYISMNSTNPQTLFGGTWQRFAQGRTIVGVDDNDSDFSMVGNPGGSKTHKLQLGEIPNHRHNLPTTAGPGSGFEVSANLGGYDGSENAALMSEVGSAQPHSILQPYITSYIWERIT